jgi:hypothetical protein
VKKEFQSLDWKTVFKLDIIDPPGLPDIKWNELYSKWGKFVPEDRMVGLVYFTKAPPESIKKKIAEQSAQARDAQNKRSRGAGDDATKESTQKSTGKKAAKI